jgi:hypothetical protein
MPFPKNLIDDFTAVIGHKRHRAPEPKPPPTLGQRVTDWPSNFAIVFIFGCFVGWLVHATVADWDARPHCGDDRIADWEQTVCEENWFVAHGHMQNSERTLGPHGEALTPVSPIPPDQLPKIRELIRRHGRDVVIELLREQGYDTEGL